MVRETLLRPVSSFWVARGADVDDRVRLKTVRFIQADFEIDLHVL